MPFNLTTAGQKSANQAARDFLAAYRKVLVKQAIKVVAGAAKSETSALAHFTGLAKISGYAPVAFADTNRGCETASVRVHPHPDWKDIELGGSKTVNLPQALTDIKPLFPGEKFISGHMINADLGGNHLLAANQTVLTSPANSQHDFDDAVKAACMRMGRVAFEMGRYCLAKNGADYISSVHKNWGIKVHVAVGSHSWYDVYKAHATLSSHKHVAAPYPLNAIATQIVFTAVAENTPTPEEIAKNLKIPESKMTAIAQNLSEFAQYMNDAARFELNQPAPADFTARSHVNSTMTPLNGNATVKISASALKPLKPGKPGKPKGASKPPPTIDSFSLQDSSGSTLLVLDPAIGDYDIGTDSDAMPWVGCKVPAITLTVDSGGALLTWKGKTGSVEVLRAGSQVKTVKDFPLKPGDVLVVSDASDTEWEVTYVST
jgi:hypothetical protein